MAWAQRETGAGPALRVGYRGELERTCPTSCRRSPVGSSGRCGLVRDGTRPAFTWDRPPSARAQGTGRPRAASGRASAGRRVFSADPRTDVAPGIPEAAICVQDVDVQCVLQFTLIHAAGCALHRRTSRVIHRLELYFRFRLAARPRNDGPGQPGRLGTDGSALRLGILFTVRVCVAGTCGTPPARREGRSRSREIL